MVGTHPGNRFDYQDATSVKYLNQTDQASLDKRSRAGGTINDQPSLTKQGAAPDCDINNIVRAFGRNFPVPPEVMDPRYYGDLSDVPDLQTALERIREAEAHFQALPSRLRSKFNNSPAELWDFINDPSNADEAVELGLLKRPDPPAAPPPQDAATGT